MVQYCNHNMVLGLYGFGERCNKKCRVGYKRTPQIQRNNYSSNCLSRNFPVQTRKSYVGFVKTRRRFPDPIQKLKSSKDTRHGDAVEKDTSHVLISLLVHSQIDQVVQSAIYEKNTMRFSCATMARIALSLMALHGVTCRDCPELFTLATPKERTLSVWPRRPQVLWRDAQRGQPR